MSARVIPFTFGLKTWRGFTATCPLCAGEWVGMSPGPVAPSVECPGCCALAGQPTVVAGPGPFYEVRDQTAAVVRATHEPNTTAAPSAPLIKEEIDEMARVNSDNVSEVVRYHRPTEVQVAAHEALAKAAEEFILAILGAAPECADRSDAIRKVREAKMTASAAVALDGLI